MAARANAGHDYRDATLGYSEPTREPDIGCLYYSERMCRFHNQRTIAHANLCYIDNGFSAPRGKKMLSWRTCCHGRCVLATPHEGVGVRLRVFLLF
jgi:hypothetical protein